MRKFIIKLFKHDLSNFKFGRKFIGGKWYRMRTGLSMGDIWCQEPFKSCQARIMEIEEY